MSDRGDMIRICAFDRTKKRWKGLQPKNQFKVPEGSVAYIRHVPNLRFNYLKLPHIIYERN